MHNGAINIFYDLKPFITIFLFYITTHGYVIKFKNKKKHTIVYQDQNWNKHTPSTVVYSIRLVNLVKNQEQNCVRDRKEKAGKMEFNALFPCSKAFPALNTLQLLLLLLVTHSHTCEFIAIALKSRNIFLDHCLSN